MVSNTMEWMYEKNLGSEDVSHSLVKIAYAEYVHMRERSKNLGKDVEAT